MVPLQLSHDFSYHLAAFSALQLLQNLGGLSQSVQTRIEVPHCSHDFSYHLASREALHPLHKRGGLLQSAQT